LEAVFLPPVLTAIGTDTGGRLPKITTDQTLTLPATTVANATVTLPGLPECSLPALFLRVA
jgi:hypothetical protein